LNFRGGNRCRNMNSELHNFSLGAGPSRRC
jgi:hypothetical protein